MGCKESNKYALDQYDGGISKPCAMRVKIKEIESSVHK